jgi:hypothetical protein
MRGLASIVVAVVGSLVLAGSRVPPACAADPPPPEATTSKAEELKTKFKTFIDTWMEKLEARERHNIAHIEWKPGERGVVGEYVGYDTTTFEVADIRNADSSSPIGRVVYMELKLRLSGASEVDALAQTPEIVERTEVTELFRYERGSWVY